MKRPATLTQRILAALAECDTVRGAARACGVSYNTIYRRARKDSAVADALADLNQRQRARRFINRLIATIRKENP